MKANEFIIRANAYRAIVQELALEAIRPQAQRVKVQEKYRRRLDAIGGLGRRRGMHWNAIAKAIFDFVNSTFDGTISKVAPEPNDRPAQPIDIPLSRESRERDRIHP